MFNVTAVTVSGSASFCGKSRNEGLQRWLQSLGVAAGRPDDKGIEREREGREEKGRRGSEVSSPFSLVLSNCCSILREVVQSQNRQSLFAQGLLLLRSRLPTSPGEAVEGFVGRRWMP